MTCPPPTPVIPTSIAEETLLHKEDTARPWYLGALRRLGPCGVASPPMEEVVAVNMGQIPAVADAVVVLGHWQVVEVVALSGSWVRLDQTESDSDPNLHMILLFNFKFHVTDLTLFLHILRTLILALSWQCPSHNGNGFAEDLAPGGNFLHVERSSSTWVFLENSNGKSNSSPLQVQDLENLDQVYGILVQVMPPITKSDSSNFSEMKGMEEGEVVPDSQLILLDPQ